MKILHVAETAKGGVGSVITDLVTSASENEHLVLVPKSHADHILYNKKYTFIRSGRNISSFLRLAHAFIKVFNTKKPEIIHLHSTYAGLIVRFLSLFIPSIRKTKIIYTPHAFPFLMTKQSVLINKLSIYLERTLSKFTDMIVCNSIYERNMALNVGIDKDKLLTIYNGVEVQSNYLCKKKIDENDTSQIKTLFVGRFDYQKGYDILLEIVRKVEGNFSFDVIGEGVNEYVERLDKNNLNYHGWLSKKEIEEYYKNSTFLIMPSRWESFGLIAVEAQSFGLPVLANNICSLPEVISTGKTGLLANFDNIDEIVHLIESIDKDYWYAMKKNCIDFSYNNFSLSSMVKNYECLYQNILRD